MNAILSLELTVKTHPAFLSAIYAKRLEGIFKRRRHSYDRPIFVCERLLLPSTKRPSTVADRNLERVENFSTMYMFTEGTNNMPHTLADVSLLCVF